MKKVIILNGSPRKNWNTYKMCESFANGVKESGGEAEIINLYDIDFKGCRSCFACKLKNGKNFGRCAYPDDLTPILDRVIQADGLVIASPIYCSDITGMTRCFIERLTFPLFQYEEGYPSSAPKRFPVAIITTMNVNEELCETMYKDLFEKMDWIIGNAFTKPVHIRACDTYQFSDYDKYAASVFDKNHKINQRDVELPKALEKAFQAGKNMIKTINNGE